MNHDLRWILVLLANLLLIALIAEINHHLTPLSLYIFPGGLLLAFAVLRLRLRQSLLANGFTALAFDALNPLPFGQTFLLFLSCHTLAFSLRGHFAKENPKYGAFVAAGMNIVLFIAITLTIAGKNFSEIDWQRTLIDGALSTIFVLFLAPWFFSLQQTALAFVGIDLDAEQREAK